jgi:hypothetical protein
MGEKLTAAGTFPVVFVCRKGLEFYDLFFPTVGASCCSFFIYLD